MKDRNMESRNSDMTAEHQLNVIGVKPERDGKISYARTTHRDAQWYPEAGLGVFFHFGINTVHGGLDISWSMMLNTSWDKDYQGKNKITPNNYYKLADSFNPKNYDPDKWLKAAADAGFRYAILTTKHHDGYALWPSKYGEMGTRTHMGGRDLVRPFVEACRKNNLRVGLYYSPPDWYFNRKYISFNYSSYSGSSIGNWLKHEHKRDCSQYDMDHKPVVLPVKPEGFEEEYKTYIANQVRELLTWYGKIDIMFFDGGPEAISMDEIRSMQPGIVINPRMHGYGDYKTPECRLPDQRPAGWWEGVYIWNYHEWGYQEPHGYRPLGWMLNNFAHCRTWNGNMLINCAPKPDGAMPDTYYERMRELKEWMAYCSESVFGVQGGPYPERCSVPVTVGNGKWYLHCLPDEEDVKGTSWYRHLVVDNCKPRTYAPQVKKAVLTGVDKPGAVYLLRSGEAIPFIYAEKQLEITIPIEKTTLEDDVVVVEWL